MQVEWVWEFITPIPPCLFFYYYFMEMKINTREGLGWCDPNLQLSSTLNTKNGRKAPESTS